jgi:hypothetical protein
MGIILVTDKYFTLALTQNRVLTDKLKKIRYVEPMMEEGFKKEFMASTMIPHKDPNKYPSFRRFI